MEREGFSDVLDPDMLTRCQSAWNSLTDVNEREQPLRRLDTSPLPHLHRTAGVARTLSDAGQLDRSHELPPRPPEPSGDSGATASEPCHTSDKEYTMKKFTVRKAGTVRLTSASTACYCGGTPVLA